MRVSGRAERAGPAPVVLAREAMRTRFEIVLADERDPAALRAAGEEALEEIARVEAELSAFSPSSALARLNAEAADAPVAVDGLMLRFLQRAGELAALTEGAFDPTVGALLARLRRAQPASDEELAAACELVGFARLVELDAAAGTVRFRRPGVRLDPGAIGKGWALDRAAELLREAGVRSALLHGGTSSVYALGAPPGADGWAVAVQDPLVPEGRLARVVLRDRALGVSAIHGRVFRRGEERVGHVLDPRSGRAVDHTLLAAVALPSATDADAVSTALLVLGEAGARAMAARVPGISALLAVRGRRGVRVVTRGAGFTRATPTRRRPAPRRT